MTTIYIGRDGKWYQDEVRIHRDTAIELLGRAYVEGVEAGNWADVNRVTMVVTSVDYDAGEITVDTDKVFN